MNYNSGRLTRGVWQLNHYGSECIVVLDSKRAYHADIYNKRVRLEMNEQINDVAKNAGLTKTELRPEDFNWGNWPGIVLGSIVSKILLLEGEHA